MTTGDNIRCIYAGFEVVLSVNGMQVTVSAANICVAIFTVIMQMGVCCNYTGGIFAVHYARDCFYCNYTGDSFSYSYVSDSFK